MKETYFFPHDYHARHDIKMEALSNELKMEGVGAYWCIVEMLYEENGYIPLSFCDRIATALRTHSDIIKSLIEDFGLFENDGTRFWSESVLRRLQERKEKSEKARKSALSKYTQSERIANASERNAIKESKVKEIKRNNVTYVGINPLSRRISEPTRISNLLKERI